MSMRVENSPVCTPPEESAPPAASHGPVCASDHQQCADTSYVVSNPKADPTAEAPTADQARQAIALAHLSAAAAMSVKGTPMDTTAKAALMVLAPTPPDVSKKAEYVEYTSEIKGVSAQAAFEYFTKHPTEWFGASGITLHPPVSELHDGDRVMLQEPGITPPVWAPIEVHLDERARTVQITTLDGHPLRGVNQFTFEENAKGEAVMHQSSVFQSSSLAARGGAHAMAVGQWLGVPGLKDPIERQHDIWAAAHANVADHAEHE